MKGRISLKKLLYMGMTGVLQIPIRSILTIVLMIFSLLVFGCFLSVMTLDKEKVRANVLVGNGILVFAGDDDMALQLSETTGESFYPIGDVTIAFPQLSYYSEELNQHGDAFDANIVFPVSDALKKATGMVLLSGRFPVQEKEIALSECVADLFIHGIFHDIVNYPLQYETLEDGAFDFKYSEEQNANIKLSNYNDLIGRKIYLNEEVVTICGVLNTHCDKNHSDHSIYDYSTLHDKYFVSEAYYRSLSQETFAIFCAMPHSTGKAFTLYLAFEDNGIEIAYDNLENLNKILDSLEDIRSFGMVASIGLVIFSLMMIGQFVSSSLDLRSKEIGIMRALGASMENVVVIFTAEGIFLGIFSVLFACLFLNFGCMAFDTVIKVFIANISSRIVTPDILAYILIALVGMAGTFFSGLLYVRHEANKTPIDCIRDNDD